MDFKKDNHTINKSLDFAVRIVNLYKYLRETKNEHVLSKQILRSGTSIGANISESQGTQSYADFIAKLHIALKESQETQYWLELLYRTDYLDENQANSLKEDINQISALIISIIKTSNQRQNKSTNKR